MAREPSNHWTASPDTPPDPVDTENNTCTETYLSGIIWKRQIDQKVLRGTLKPKKQITVSPVCCVRSWSQGAPCLNQHTHTPARTPYCSAKGWGGWLRWRAQENLIQLSLRGGCSSLPLEGETGRKEQTRDSNCQQNGTRPKHFLRVSCRNITEDVSRLGISRCRYTSTAVVEKESHLTIDHTLVIVILYHQSC